MKMGMCSKVRALFVEVCSFDDSIELCATASVRKGGKDVVLDFSFFVEVLDDDLNFMLFDDGSWSVEYVFASKEKSWFPDVPCISDTLVFDGLGLKLVHFE